MNKKSLIKGRTLFFFTITFILFAQQSFSQGSPYCVKKKYVQVAVYDSPKSNATILFFIDNKSFFYCDTLIGKWYSCEMPHVYESTVTGYVYKDSVQLFKQLSLNVQKNIFNRTFNKYYNILLSPEKKVLIPSLWIADSMYLVPVRELYYNNTFYPVLSSFSQYYKRTSDTSTLLNIFKFSPYADGEFATEMDELYYECYMRNNSLFIKSLKKIKGKKYFRSAKGRLIQTINNHSLSLRNRNLQNAEIKKLERL